eukprot:15326127-Ditylum_brightwellii.AAC.1
MEVKWVQDIVCTLLYYYRAIDPILAAALSTILSQQVTAMKQMKEACHQLLDYVATHPNTMVQFMASNMILAAHLDVLP